MVTSIINEVHVNDVNYNVSETNDENYIVNDCSKVEICGSRYAVSDIIIFEILENKNRDYYMRVIIYQDDNIKMIFTFYWDKIPVDVMDIYKYVKNTSTTEYNDDDDIMIIYGEHIGRTKNNKFKIIEIEKEKYNQISDNVVITNKLERQEIKMFFDIAENMRIVKKLLD